MLIKFITKFNIIFIVIFIVIPIYAYTSVIVPVLNIIYPFFIFH